MVLVVGPASGLVSGPPVFGEKNSVVFYIEWGRKFYMGNYFPNFSPTRHPKLRKIFSRKYFQPIQTECIQLKAKLQL